MAEETANNEVLADALKTGMPANYKDVVPNLTKRPQFESKVFLEQQPSLDVRKDYLAMVTPGLEQLRSAEEKKLKDEADLKLEKARAEGAKYKRLAESAAQQKREILEDPTRAEYKQALEAKAKPFIPHEENTQDMIALFGLLNVLGFAIGSGGKENAQTAMAAMNGMLEGHQKGREDLYKKEKSVFETNQKQLDSRIKQLLAFMQDTELLSGMDKTARDQKIEGEFLEQQAENLKKFYETRGYGPTVEYLKQLNKANDKAAEFVQQEKQRALDQKFAISKFEAEKRLSAERAQQDYLNRIDLEQQKLQVAADKAFAQREFDLARDLQNRIFELRQQEINFKRAENLAKINRDHLDAIELARKADVTKDRELRAEADKRLEDIRQKELDERIQHDRATEANERARIAELEKYHKAMLAAKTGGAGGTQKVTQQMAIAQRAVNSLGGLASAVESIKELPTGTTTGILPNLQTKDGMINYVRNTVGRKITSREAEMLNTLFTGIGRNLASVEASGVATGLSELSKQMQSGVYINSGVDDPYKVALKLADIRRIAVENIRPAIESGLMPKGQAEVASKLVERIEKAIPYSTIDVIKAASGGKQTIGEAAERAVRGGKSYKTEAEAEAAFKAGTLKAGERVIINGVSGTWE